MQICPRKKLSITKKFLVKLFLKASEERRLFEKWRHPKTSVYYSGLPALAATAGPSSSRSAADSRSDALLA
ncbi:hypothetical protein CXP35_09900 [Komagataeibacter xylinus]|nr:hypothetical protein CXP35_09900 [Komagataeibacter xylinus]